MQLPVGGIPLLASLCELIEKPIQIGRGDWGAGLVGMISSKPERARSLVANFRGSVSRLTLSASLGLAGVSALPATSWADCVVGLSNVVCSTTVTTDTSGLGPFDRNYEASLATPLLMTVDPGAAVSGYGLSAKNTGNGGVTVVNNGTISVDAGNTPSAGGSEAALYISAEGGLLSYTGGAIANNGSGQGLFAIQNGAGAIDISLDGAVTSADNNGISVANNNFAGTDITVNATGVTAAQVGIFVFNGGTGSTVVTSTGVVQGGTGGVVVFQGTPAGNVTVEAVDTAVLASGLGNAAMMVTSQGTGTVSITSTGNADGALTSAGIAGYSGLTATSLTIEAASASGGVYGIQAVNSGTGATGVTATGDVIGGFAGIRVINGQVDAADFLDVIIDPAGPAGTDLTVSATTATGGNVGIYTINNGSGATEVTATGLVQGGASGIAAFNEDTATDLTIHAAATAVLTETGEEGAAILAVNRGTGATSVTATGNADGTLPLAGIGVYNGVTATSLDIVATSATGWAQGIVAVNSGAGATSVTATGDVVGGFAGISVTNGQIDEEDFLDPFVPPSGPAGTDLTIQAANVTGGLAGIITFNGGTGNTSVTSTGLVQGEQAGVYALSIGNGDAVLNLTDVTATEGIGIAALSPGGGSIGVTVTGAVQAAFAGLQVLSGGNVAVNVADVIVTDDDSVGVGVVAGSGGVGTVNVTSTGLIQAGTTGIQIDSEGGDVVVNANAITLTSPEGGGAGIDLHNHGFGSSTVTVTGSVDAGAGDLGIGVYNDLDATFVAVNAASASGAEYGILVWNDGSGPTSITTSGIILGGHAGISVDTISGSPTTIVNNGTLANRDMLPTSLAVEAFGGAMDFTNNGTLLGTIYFDGFDAILTNAGIWYVPGGTSEFGGGTNSLVNEAGGTIVAGTADGMTATTLFNNVGTFTNRGTFTMAGGAAGDRATLNGNASFEAGSVYAVDLGAGSAADLLTVNGTVALLAGSTVAPDLQGGLIDGERYTVLTATGGVTGEFGSVDAPATAFLSVEDFYDANNVYLDVTQYRSFQTAGLTPNQIATATGLQSLPASNALFNAILNLPTDAQARAAFDSLSGEIGASAKGVLLKDSQFLRSAVFDRLTSAGSSTPAGGIAVAPLNYAAPAKSNVPYPVKAEPALVAVPESAFWAQGFGSWGDTNGNSNAAGLDRDTGGFFIGADTLVGDAWRLGVLGGYSQTSFDVDARASSGESDNFHVGAYAGTKWGAVNFRAGASYTWNDISTSRSVFIPTAQLLEADYDAGTAQVFGELGYGLTFGAVDFEPFVGLAYVNLQTDGYAETGGIAALSSGSDSTDATYSTLGLRAATTFALGSFEATAKGMLGWRHAFGDITPTSAYQFASGSSPFTVGGVPIAEDAALVEVGLDLQLLPLATFGVAYGGQFGDGATDQSFTANLSVKF